MSKKDLLLNRSENMEVAVPQELESQFKELMNSYLSLLSKTRQDSFFSVMGFITFYAKFLWWEINLLFLPLVAVINALIFILNKLRQKQINYVPYIFLRYLKKMFQSVRGGEVPALKFFTARYLTNLFIQLHIKKRIKQINRILSIQELKNNLQSNDSQISSSIQIQKETIKGFDNIISPGIELKFIFSLILPFFGIIKSLFHINFEKFDFASYFSNNRFSLNFILYSLFIVIYLLNLLVSCFIRKREIFLESNIYKKENIFSTISNQQLGFEFPLDLIGWIVIVLIFSIPYLFTGEKTDEFGSIIIIGILYSTPFIYALIKRVKLKNL